MAIGPIYFNTRVQPEVTSVLATTYNASPFSMFVGAFYGIFGRYIQHFRR